MAKKPTVKPIKTLDDGWQARFGAHELHYHRRAARRLLVSFSEFPNDKGKPDRTDWAVRICEERDWSHLHVMAHAADWYRDAELIGFFEGLQSGGFAAPFAAVGLTGISMGGFAALSFAPYFPGATVAAFSPQSTLDPKRAPWDDRFPEAAEADWSLPGSDAAETLRGAKRVTIVHDPFTEPDKRHVDRLSGDNLQVLRGFGMQHALALHLTRMRLFDPVLVAALGDDLDHGWFYEQIRSRKDYYFYRIGIEATLEARGQSKRLQKFRQAFRQRRQQNDAAQAVQAVEHMAAKARPTAPGEWARIQDNKTRWPCEPGNVWMLEARDDSLRYMSDRWHGVLMGYEERGGITLAQTPPLVQGVVAFGHGGTVERPLPRRFLWHVTDETLDGTMPGFAALSEATIQAEYIHAHHGGLPQLMAITGAQPGITGAEALPDGTAFAALTEKIRAGVTALAPWGKRLFIDRIGLSLLAGSPHVSEEDAAEHYADVSYALRDRLSRLTGQDSSPFIVVTQSAGTRTDGSSEVILAEGRADLDNPALDIIVAGPSYPYPLMPGTPGTIRPDAALLMDELRYIAVAERQAGRDWYCPSLQFAELRGTTITATFSTLAPLRLLAGAHGFHIEGSTRAVQITGAQLSGDKTVELTCDTHPEGDALMLCYAWGQKADGTEHRFANTGALRDAWAQPSRITPKARLYRHALSGRTKIIRQS